MVSVSVLIYFFYWKPGTVTPRIKNSPAASKDVTKVKDQKKPVVVEDVEDEEESDEEESSDEEEEEGNEEVTQLEVKKEPTKTSDQSESSEKKTAEAPKPTESGEKSTSPVKGSDLPEKDEATLLKEQYDAAVRLGQKLIAGGLNERAVEKLSEAISLAAKVPSAQKDILTLYNNRSAMYEKLGQFENSTRDINIVLAMDAFHVKARVRRARVFEAQGKVQQALNDYVFATIVERARGSEANYDKKITELSKFLAIERTPKTLKDLRSVQKKRSLPSKAYCRNFMEAYPNSYAWKDTYYGVAREELASNYAKSRAEIPDSSSSSSDKQAINAVLEAGLELVKYDLAHEAYKKAFETLRDIPFASLDATSLLPSLASLYHELRGTELHLMFQMQDALKEYEQATTLNPANITAQLKYNSVLLENGEREQALASYSQLIAILQKSVSDAKDKTKEKEEDADFDKVNDKSSDEDFFDARASPVSLPLSLEQESKEAKIAYMAWVFNHRASLWVSRDENGFFASDALVKAIEDLDTSLNLSGDAMHLPEGKGAHFIALLKSVQIRTHTKQAMEQVTTEQDYAHNRQSIQAAKGLFPQHESVLLLEVEQLSLEGEGEASSSLVEKAAKSGNYDEFIIVNLRATITTNQAFLALQGNAANVQNVGQAQMLFEEVNRLYQRALELDPESLEVKAQFAQLKSMMFGDLEGAISLLKDALAIARSRDEVQDLLTMLVGNEAQANAIEEIKKSQQ